MSIKRSIKKSPNKVNNYVLYLFKTEIRNYLNDLSRTKIDKFIKKHNKYSDPTDLKQKRIEGDWIRKYLYDYKLYNAMDKYLHNQSKAI